MHLTCVYFTDWEFILYALIGLMCTIVAEFIDNASIKYFGGGEFDKLLKMMRAITELLQVVMFHLDTV